MGTSIRDIEDKRARERDKASKGRTPDATRKLIEGTTTQGWNQALGALVLAYPERLAAHIN